MGQHKIRHIAYKYEDYNYKNIFYTPFVKTQGLLNAQFRCNFTTELRIGYSIFFLLFYVGATALFRKRNISKKWVANPSMLVFKLLLLSTMGKFLEISIAGLKYQCRTL